MAISKVLKAAIEAQKSRITYDSTGNPLCRHCNNVVPENYRVLYYNPETPQQVWGPCCCNECIAYTKVCSGCNKDFFVDKKDEKDSSKEQIEYIGDGVSLCQECLSKLSSCDICGRKTTPVDSPDGKKICERCLSNNYFTCTICNNIHSNSVEFKKHYRTIDYLGYAEYLDVKAPTCTTCYKKVIKGKIKQPIDQCKFCGEIFNINTSAISGYCSHCVKRGYIKQCHYCKTHVHDYSSYNKETTYYCRGCVEKHSVEKCNVCGKSTIYPFLDKVKLLHRTGLICKNCNSATKKLTECSQCFSIKKEGIKCSLCSRYAGICDECGNTHLGEPGCRKDLQTHLMNYSYKPHTIFNYLNKNSKVFFGFENEINYETSVDSNIAIKNIYKYFKATEIWVKSDGSISGPGFEAVSGPMDLPYFNSMDINSLFLVKPKVNDDSCGLHVHIDKNSFNGKAHLYKFISFINDNKEFIKFIAGRTYNGYNKQYKNKKHVLGAIRKKEGIERYHAVNITNKNTYEVRIFKSARNEYQLRYRIEFVHALVEYTRECSIKGCSVEAFIKSISSNYSNLYKFIKEWTK